MGTWFAKAVGDGQEADGPTRELFDAFAALETASEVEPGTGVFSRYDLEVDAVTWYFSPEAAALARTFGATPCEKPAPDEALDLLVGSASSWDRHFPGRR